jgi:hypothetical protein
MHGAIPPLPSMPLWHDAQFKKKAQRQLYFYFTRMPTFMLQ